jgi:hypothetical protein
MKEGGEADEEEESGRGGKKEERREGEAPRPRRGAGRARLPAAEDGAARGKRVKKKGSSVSAAKRTPCRNCADERKWSPLCGQVRAQRNKEVWRPTPRVMRCGDRTQCVRARGEWQDGLNEAQW